MFSHAYITVVVDLPSSTSVCDLCLALKHPLYRLGANTSGPRQVASQYKSSTFQAKDSKLTCNSNFLDSFSTSNFHSTQARQILLFPCTLDQHGCKRQVQHVSVNLRSCESYRNCHPPRNPGICKSVMVQTMSYDVNTIIPTLKSRRNGQN